VREIKVIEDLHLEAVMRLPRIVPISALDVATLKTFNMEPAEVIALCAAGARRAMREALNAKAAGAAAERQRRRADPRAPRRGLFR